MPEKTEPTADEMLDFVQVNESNVWPCHGGDGQPAWGATYRKGPRSKTEFGATPREAIRKAMEAQGHES